jgi:multicomponent Na+:H+ antiporter subunit D
MTASLMPGLPILLGALFVPLLRGHLQKAFLLLLPVIGLAQLVGLEQGSLVQLSLFDYDLNPVRIDRLSLVWGYIFHIALLFTVVFSLHLRDSTQHVAGLVYAGSAIGAVFAGDLITLFVYWELTAISSVFLIWASRTERSYRAGMRYLIVQVGSGVLLLAGVLLVVAETGSLSFERMELSGAGPWLIFLAFGIKAAFPLLHGWLQDAYPEATATGTVFLSAFTTKLAIYALARSFPGTDLLIPIGATMVVFPLIYAFLEDDLRRVLAYALNNQLGFMVVGVGVGTELAINGVAAHAFGHILYKLLLFMALGAVLYRTGTARASELGGLHRSMPWTLVFCLLGGAASSLPLFCGFVGKSLIVSASAHEHHEITWALLVLAAAGVFLVLVCRLPVAAFFGPDTGRRCDEAPANMLIAMGLTAAACIGVGLFPGHLYGILPYAVDYDPYTVSHVVNQLQLVAFAALAFALLYRWGLFSAPAPTVTLDVDVLYRKLLPWIIRGLGGGIASLRDGTIGAGKQAVGLVLAVVHAGLGPTGVGARTLLTSTGVAVAILLLALHLLVYYLF